MIKNIENIYPETVLFCDFLIAWNNSTKFKKSPSTYDGYVGMISKYIYPYFKSKKLLLTQIKPMHLDGYESYLLHNTNLSINTIRKHHEVIRACLNYAYKNDFIEKNPYKAFSLPRKEETEMKYYTQEQLLQLMKVALGTSLESFIYLSVWFGMRKSEVLGLRWQYVDFKNSVIYVRETRTRIKDYNTGHWVDVQNTRLKTAKSRRNIPMSPEQIMYLNNLHNNSISEYVVTGNNGKPLKYDYILPAFKKLLKKNNLPIIRVHDLRHSNATFLLNNGFNMKQVQEWLGHSTYKLTADTYTHVNETSKVNMSNAVGSVLAPYNSLKLK